MPITVEREKLARSIYMLSDREAAAVAALVERLLDDEPPLSACELEQVAGAEKDIEAGRMIPWEALKKELEALP